MSKTGINLNRISFFKPIVGLTFREQLKGMKLAGPEVVDYLRSIGWNDGTFVPPPHWEKPGSGHNNYVYGFSLMYIAPQFPGSKGGRCIHGFCWDKNHFGYHCRSFDHDDVMDIIVGEEWDKNDWILIETTTT